MAEQKKRVGIIGSGPSGLVSAKYAIENGMIPVVFEKTSKIFGLWSGRNTTIYHELKSNTSRFLSSFSDFPWPPSTDIYPYSYEILDYLTSFAKKFELEKFVRLNHRVEFVRCIDQGGKKTWQLNYSTSTSREIQTEEFDFLIIASGAFQRAHLPDMDNMTSFKGLVLHSYQFRLNDSRLKLKDVVVVGGSLSAVDLVSQLVEHAGSIYHVFRHPPVILPLLCKFKVLHQKNKHVPYEHLLFTRAANYAPDGWTDEEFDRKIRERLKKMAPFQADKNSECPESLHVDFENIKEPVKIGISDRYIDSVKDNKIEPIKSQIDKFFENGVLLDNGRYIPADVVIFCTGYKLAASEFLDKPILEAFNYNEETPKLPIILYKETFAPEFETLAYVGLAHEANFIGFELQARWAMSVFAGKLPFPERSRMDTFINELKNKRQNDRSEQFPYGNFVYLVDNYAEELGLKPDLNKLKETDQEMYDYLWNDLVHWPHFMGQDDETKSRQKATLREIRELNLKNYETKH